MNSFLEEAISVGLAHDGVVAQNAQERSHMWRLRYVMKVTVGHKRRCEHKKGAIWGDYGT